MRPSTSFGLELSVDALSENLYRFRWPVLAACLLVSLVMASGLTRIGFSTDYRVFFGAENPHLQAYEDLQATYQKEDNILLVLAPETGDVFTPPLLAAMRDLTEQAWTLPYATRVDSLTNFQHSTAQGDDISIAALVGADRVIDAAAVDDIRRVALSEPALAGILVARDSRATGLNIMLTLPGESTQEVPEAMAEARRLAAAFRAAHPDVRVAVTGAVALNNAFVEAALTDGKRLFPVVYGVVFLATLLIFRSLVAVVGMIAVVGLSSAGALGLAGWSGLLLNPVSAAAPLVITTVATADAVHLLTSMNGRLQQGAAKRDAIADALAVNMFPVSLTSLTTAIGFLSLNASDAPPYRDLGNISALGVAFAWFLSIVLLPALLHVLPAGRAVARSRLHVFDGRMMDRITARPKTVLAAAAIVALALAACIPRIELNDQFVEYFAPNIAFRADTEFAAERLTGLYQLEFSVDAGSPGGIAEPDYLQRLDAFVGWLRSQPEVTHVAALTDVIRRLNKSMHGDDPARYRLPDSRDLAAQYLLLFEMSVPQGQDLRNRVDIDRSASRVVATLENISTRETQALKRRAEDWLRQNFPTAEMVQATGPAVMFAYISETNIRSMLTGVAIALGLISLCLVGLLRSVRLGLLSIIPNVLPIVMAFGVWGATVERVGLAAAMVAAVTLGLVVDNTVHVLAKYRRARNKEGLSCKAAIRRAYAVVGPALVSSTVILLCGFVILSFSSFQANAELGLLSAITLCLALLADIVILPVLVLVADGRRTR